MKTSALRFLRVFCLLSALLALTCCDLFLKEETYTDIVVPPDQMPSDSLYDEELPKEKHLYMTGVEFPEGYDWQKDTAYGTVNAKIIFYRDSERILSLETGSSQEISADSDMHHMSGGHLFTEYSGPSETVIRRDGVLLYRFPGREVLKGLLVSGDDVYTLSQNRSGVGLEFRMNGRSIFQDASGEVLGSMYEVTMLPSGALYEDKGHICFCYSKRITMGGTVFRLWYQVRDGEAQQLPLPSDLDTVYDIRIYGSESYLVCSEDGVAPILRVGDKRYDLSSSQIKAAKDYRLFYDEGEVFICGTAKDVRTGEQRTGIWNKYGLQYSFEGTRTKLYSFSLSPSYLFYENSGKLACYSQYTDDYIFPGNYYLLSCRNACSDGDKLYIALTSKGENPTSFLFCNGEITDVKINGFLTGVSVDY